MVDLSSSVVTLLLGFYFFSESLIKDMQINIGECGKADTNEPTISGNVIKKRILNIIQFHADIKQLNVNFKVFQDNEIKM